MMRLALAILLFPVLAFSQAQTVGVEAKSNAVASYAELVSKHYSACVESATALREKIDGFLAEPTEASLTAARDSWIAARKAYNPTEVFRFYGGPIDSAKDGVETYLNAWPIDEGYLDYVEGQPTSGVVFDTKRVPVISPTVLKVINEQGGEANISCGWHAIEFLLWGQDLDADGPGARPATDYTDAPGATRRGELLRAATGLLVEQLRQVNDAWAPGQNNYRKAFEKNVDDSMKHILTGVCVLAGFELSGERIAVAYETRDQEDEHSCFSDTTHLDVLGNIEGIEVVYSTSLKPLATLIRPGLAKQLSAHLDACKEAAGNIRVPFDRAITSRDKKDREQLLATVQSLEFTAIAFSAFASELGYTVPIQPDE